MPPAFYDTSVASFLQGLKAMHAVLDKAEQFAAENSIDVEDFVKIKLRDDMLPFSFQVISVWHHSMGAMKAFESGVFEPPPKMSAMTWPRLRALINEATEYLEALSSRDVNTLSGRDMLFRIGGRDLPFTTDNFLMSFSLPNFYFHATTTYAILRMQGVPLGKMDYIGKMRMGH